MFVHRKIIETVPFFGQVPDSIFCLYSFLHARPFCRLTLMQSWYWCASRSKPPSFISSVVSQLRPETYGIGEYITRQGQCSELFASWAPKLY